MAKKTKNILNEVVTEQLVKGVLPAALPKGHGGNQS